jgi:CheY-like chemotaxis protein
MVSAKSRLSNESSPIPAPGMTLKILIVDDDVDIRELLAELLESRGFDVITAANGLEAIDLLKSMAAPPSIILLDLMMPVMDGYAFLEERKKVAVLASIPVAIITAGHGVDRNQLGSAGAVVKKPIDPLRLVNVIDSLHASAQSP